jgi:hypothetical protein
MSKINFKKVVGAIVLLALALPMTIFSFNLEENLTEQFYIEKIRSYNHSVIETKADDTLITYAYETCAMLDSGKNVDDVRKYIMGDLKKTDAVLIYGAIVVKLSVDIFCPQYTDQTEAWVY